MEVYKNHSTKGTARSVDLRFGYGINSPAIVTILNIVQGSLSF